QDEQLALQLGGLPVVVRIEEGHQVPPRPIDAEVARARGAPVGLADQGDAVPVRAEGRGEVVRAAVIDHDDLLGGPRLGADAVDGPRDRAGRAVRGDDDAHGGWGHGGSSLSFWSGRVLGGRPVPHATWGVLACRGPWAGPANEVAIGVSSGRTER